jgi:hypothetical protein
MDQKTFCYCPQCNGELVAANCPYEDDGQVVTYHCECGTMSRWLFDAPVPLLLEPK